MKVLHIDSSIMGKNSVTRQLTASIVSELQAKNPSAQVEYLDLAVDTPTHLSADSLGFRAAPQEGAPLSAVQQAENALSEKLVSQFLDASVIVIGTPLYNFTIPTQLKAWIDRVAQPGRTFTYTENGPVGLAGGKTVIVALSRGGIYSGSEQMQALEHQESYLAVMLGFMGVTDVRFVRAEGVAMGEAKKTEALASAASVIKALTVA